MITYLKRATPRPPEENSDLRDQVRIMLARIEADGEEAVRGYAQRLDGWQGGMVLSDEARRAACARVPPQALQNDIRFAHDNIRRFAEAQMATVQDCEVELLPGHWAGQRQIPVSAAGCYVPGGRYSHVASALMTITTAKVAGGVGHITAASPPRDGGLPDAVVFAMDLAGGADAVLTLGGVQAIATMANGLFGLPEADILCGPGNAYVAEAKRALFGRVGIDMFAGPTDSLVIADDTADPETVTWDLVGQAEHGPDSPVWLVTTSRNLANHVLTRAPMLAESLPEPNAAAARVAWTDRAEVILCETAEEMAQVADRYAPEHLHVQAADLDWWLSRLTAYGSLFLGGPKPPCRLATRRRVQTMCCQPRGGRHAIPAGYRCISSPRP